MRRLTDQPVREGLDGAGDCEPEDAVTEEAGDGAEEEDGPGRKAVGDEAGQEADVLANVVGYAEEGELVLVKAEDGLEGVGVEGEIVGVA